MSGELFFEARNVRRHHSGEDEFSHLQNVSSSTPIRGDTGRSLSVDHGQQLLNFSPLLNQVINHPVRNRSHTIDLSAGVAHNTASMIDLSTDFNINPVINHSFHNDSGVSDINDCSFRGKHIQPKSLRSLRKQLLNDTPPGVIVYDEDEQMVSELEDTTGTNKRGLSDSYLAQQENSPTVPLSKRQVNEEVASDVLPVVPCCFDASFDRVARIGDNSREYLLPYNASCNSEHCDFKCITPETLSDVMNGKFNSTIDSFIIIDTRYPYEYNGGHIAGAVNVVTKEDMTTKFLDKPANVSDNQVVVFHCEFSSKRGPSMCRFTRDQDRVINKSRYPFLYYPEMYILHGGYKDFYPLYPCLCTPSSYCPMLEPEYANELQYWQKTTKTSTGGDGHNNVRGLKCRTRSRQLLLP